LTERVAARQAELEAARTSVDAPTSAMANLNRMRALWEQRYRYMSDPGSIDAATQLRQPSALSAA
jgi:hypothetical protein